MKKLITASALIAAGALFANANDTFTFTTADGTQRDGGGFAGVIFTLSENSTRFSSSATSSALSFPSSVNLDSITIAARDGQAVNADRYLYLTDSNGLYVGASNSTTTTTSNTYTFDFSNITLTLGESYHALFYRGKPSFQEGAPVAQNQVNSVQLAAAGLFDAGSVNDWGFLQNGVTTQAPTFAPVMTITTSVIPEPSAFGLLAGLGALALVGTRRRRR